MFTTSFIGKRNEEKLSVPTIFNVRVKALAAGGFRPEKSVFKVRVPEPTSKDKGKING